MNITLVRALAGLGAAGIAGVGGYGIYVASQKEETIFDSLTKKGLTLLKTEGTADDVEWGKKVNLFNAGTDQLEGFEKKTPSSHGDENREDIKKACKNLIRISAKDALKLTQAEKWCVKDKNPS